MGIYLNNTTAYTLYKNETAKPYFVDKSDLLDELFPLITEGNNYICITRPRRFGKTIMANMIVAFLGKHSNSHDIFDSLHIYHSNQYQAHINQHNVIHISLNEVPEQCNTFQQYLSRIRNRLVRDLKQAYPDCNIDETEAVWDILKDIYEYQNKERFVFVLDEWDYIFHQSYINEADKKAYIQFLSNLLKDKPYVSLAYMTGILPIAKYSSGSELNMFLEYTMGTREKYSDYFGFTEEEVDMLYQRYLNFAVQPTISREDLKIWYDGYQTVRGKHVYNPRSIVCALRDNQLSSYWTSSGPYDEIFYYIEKNIDDVRDSLAYMVSGIPVPAKIQEYAATSMHLSTKDEIFSAMVVYGFLSYDNGYVSIPNKELMDKFNDMLHKERSLGYVYELAKASEKMLTATLNGDTKTMVQLLEFAHNTEIPLLQYNHETELTALVNLLYLSARDFYRIEREDKAGVGYVDFIFYPERNLHMDCIIIELKVDSDALTAINQIKERQYALRFLPKVGEQKKYTGRILAVGIGYDKVTKKHSCQIEVLRE